jgi:hypothetical protein
MTRNKLIDMAVREAEREIGPVCNLAAPNGVCAICALEIHAVVRSNWPTIASRTEENAG